jgi:hypothetical protein
MLHSEFESSSFLANYSKSYRDAESTLLLYCMPMKLYFLNHSELSIKEESDIRSVAPATCLTLRLL